MVGNYLLHGPPSDPIIKTAKEPLNREFKSCPECFEPVKLYTRVCPNCGYSWKEEKDEDDDMVMVDKGNTKLIEIDMSRRRMPSKVNYWDANKYISSKNNKMIRLILNCKPGGDVSTYLDFEGNASEYGQTRARRFWRRLAKSEPPETVEEAVARLGELRIPETVDLYPENNFLKVMGW